MTPEQREKLISQLGGVILVEMERNQDMVAEAVYEGRVGLLHMSDEELAETAAGWGVVLK